MTWHRCGVGFLVATLLAWPLWGQTFQVRRESVLAIDMTIQAVTPPRVLSATEIVLPTPAAGTAPVRMHLRIVRADAAGALRVRAPRPALRGRLWLRTLRVRLCSESTTSHR